MSSLGSRCVGGFDIWQMCLADLLHKDMTAEMLQFIIGMGKTSGLATVTSWGRRHSFANGHKKRKEHRTCAAESVFASVCAKAISNAMPNATRLVVLHLYHNNIGDEGAEAIANSLLQRASLNCKIQDVFMLLFSPDKLCHCWRWGVRNDA